MLCLMTGDRTSLLAKASGLKWIMYRPAGHLHFFSEKSLEYILTLNKMKIIKKYWNTGNVANYNSKLFNLAKQLFNVIYDSTPLTKMNKFDHMYIFSAKQ